jgi:hypothetical protein
MASIRDTQHLNAPPSLKTLAMSAITEAQTFGFGSSTEIGKFVVDFSQTTKQLVNRKGKNGDYTATEYSIVVQSALSTSPMLLTGVSSKHYDRMRILSLQGLKNLTVSRGIAPLGQPSSFAPYIISGVKDA